MSRNPLTSPLVLAAAGVGLYLLYRKYRGLGDDYEIAQASTPLPVILPVPVSPIPPKPTWWRYAAATPDLALLEARAARRFADERKAYTRAVTQAMQKAQGDPAAFDLAKALREARQLKPVSRAASKEEVRRLLNRYRGTQYVPPPEYSVTGY